MLLLFHLGRIYNFLRARARALFRPATPTTHDRELKRHRRRLVADGIAMSLSGALISATGPVMNGVDRSSLLFFSHPMVEDMEPAVSVKCDVCLLSHYTQLFVALDAILGSELDFENAEREETDETVAHVSSAC